MSKRSEYDEITVGELRPGDSILQWHPDNGLILVLVIGVVHDLPDGTFITAFVPPPMPTTLERLWYPTDSRVNRMKR